MLNSEHVLVRIYLLGRFEISRAGHILNATTWTRRKAAALLQRLALDRRLLKEPAIDFLWPDASLAPGANNLYRTIHALRQTLNGALGDGAADAIFSFNDGILVLHDSVWVDTHEFERLGQARATTANLQKAVDLYRGDLLPDDPYSDWLHPPRERLRRLYRECCLVLNGIYLEQGDHGRALSLLAPLVTDDPADETTHRALMRLYAQSGRRHEALRQYQACVDALAAELDAQPSPETEALYERILRGELPPLSRPATPAPLAVESAATFPIVGRESEVTIVRRALQRARDGQGHTILLSGETGVGKTRIAYETLQIAEDAGLFALYGACYEQEGQLPYQPFVEAINRYLARQQRPFSENPITHHMPLGKSDPQQEQWALFNAAAAFLINLAAQAPVTLIIDDLHAADEASLRLFHYLARQTRQAPIILQATYRSDMAFRPSSPFGILLNALYRERLQTVINVTPLGRQAAADLIAQTLAGEAAPELSGLVFTASEGNPFFMEEMLHALKKRDRLEQVAGQWALKAGAALQIPAGLSKLLQSRIAQLGDVVVLALETAAVAGREFSFDVLRRAASLSDNDLFTALDLALAGRLLEETAAGYRFRHGLIRSVIYDSQSRPRRARRHSFIGQAIEAVYGERPPGVEPFVEALAYHYLHSDARRHALPYLLKAGEKAANLFAFEVAVAYFEQALALMDELGLAEPAMRWQILASLGWWGVILADTARAVQRFEQALALPPTESWQPGRSGRVWLYRGAAVSLMTAGDTAAAEKHLAAALSLVDEEEDAAEYALLLYTAAQLRWHRNEYQPAFDLAQRSLRIAERLNDSEAVARAFEMLALACHSTGDWQQGLLFEEQRASLAGPALDVSEAFDVHL
jgi:DNA-binding SARP family transcriptional activator